MSSSIFRLIAIVLSFFAFVNAGEAPIVHADKLGRCAERPPAVEQLGLVASTAPAIYRWKKGTTVSVYVAANTFTQNGQDVAIITAYVNKAIKSWNSAAMGLTFAATTSPTYANIIVTNGYAGPSQTFGDCQFPSASGFSTMRIYNFWFSSIKFNEGQGARDHAVTSVEHEMGHFLGFNHEFDAQTTGYASLSSADQYSVMGYEDTRFLTTKDIADSRLYYNVGLSYFPGQTITEFNLRKYVPPQGSRYCCQRVKILSFNVCVRYCS